MPNVTFEIQIRAPWWFRLYAAGISVVAFLTGLEPNQEKLEALFQRHVRTNMVEKKYNS